MGKLCPLCGTQSTINFMMFRDPHGVDRVDPELFECGEKKHIFVRATAGYRLLSSEGKRSKESLTFEVLDGTLKQK